MNRLTPARLPDALMMGLVALMGHVLALFFMGAVFVVTWIHIVAPLMGFDDRVIHLNGFVIATIIVAYATFVIGKS